MIEKLPIGYQNQAEPNAEIQIAGLAIKINELIEAVNKLEKHVDIIGDILDSQKRINGEITKRLV